MPQVPPPWLFLTFLLPKLDELLEEATETALSLTLHKAINPTVSPLSLNASRDHALCSRGKRRGLFRERFAGNDTILEPQTCPNQALQQLWSCPIAALAPYAHLMGWKQQRLCKRGPFSQTPDEPWARNDPLVLWERAQRSIYKPFYLSTCQRKGTCSGVWLTLSHPPPTYNNQVSPHFPQERSTWKQLLIAQLLVQGSVCCRGSFWLWAAWQHRNCHQPHKEESRDQHRLLANKLGLLPPWRMQKEDQTLFNDLMLPLWMWVSRRLYKRGCIRNDSLGHGWILHLRQGFSPLGEEQKVFFPT